MIDLDAFKGHTPGSWSAASWDAESPKPDDPAIMAGEEPVVSLMWYDGPVLAISESDARLIAAAPDLLAMCREQAETIARLTADLTEARAEIAALRGLPEGAVSEHWRCESGEWVRPTEDDRCALVAHPDGAAFRWAHLTPGRRMSGTAPTLRDAMRAADAAAGVGS